MIDNLKIAVKLLPILQIVYFTLCVIIQNVTYGLIMFNVANILSNRVDIPPTESPLFGNGLLVESASFLVFLVFTYLFVSLIAFIYQIYLSNCVMSKLSQETVSNYDYSTVLSGKGINASQLLKDSTAEIPRIANNVINPILEAIRNVITTFIIAITLFILSPNLFGSIFILFLFFLIFWLGTQTLFKRMAIQISENLYDRQRSAEYFFQSIVHADQEDHGYKYPANLFLRSVENLVILNVRSKSIAYLPRLLIEGGVLAVILFGGLMVETSLDAFVLLGMAALRILPSIQGLSAAVSNIQTNLFGLASYYERLQLMRDNKNRFYSQNANKFPRNLPGGSYRSKCSNIQFKLRKKISLPRVGIVLLKGPSGIGKSTFLRIIAGLEPGRFDTTQNFTPGYNDVDFVQQGDIPMRGTVAENLFGCAEAEKLEFQSDRYLAAQDYYALLFEDPSPDGLKNILYSEFGRNSGFSGGEIKRLMLIKSLCSGASVLVWDEPFDGIQANLVKRLLEFLSILNKKRIFLIDHNTVDLTRANKIMSFDMISGEIVIEAN